MSLLSKANASQLRPIINISTPSYNYQNLTHGSRKFINNVAKKSFNPRPPHGGDQEGFGRARHVESFNPRPPHGGRRSRSRDRALDCRFNPRPPHGGRPPSQYIDMSELTFQSTPPARYERYNKSIPI